MKDASLFLVAVALFCSSNAAALVPTKPSILPQRATIQVNGYRNEWGEGGGGGGTTRGDASANRPRARPSQQVPLLGPIPGAPPLLLGGEMTLDPPTPLQWQALEESVILHQQYLKEQGGNETTAGAQTTGVDAAPLVAVIDDVTGIGTSGRYATLAAVVGISSSQKAPSRVTLDTSDETSFMESLKQVGTQRSPLKSCIRLVGVGRASLKEFLYKLPTNLDEKEHDEEDDDDDEEDLVEAERNDEDDHDDEEEQQTPIVMAEFTLLRDTSVSSTAEEKRLGEKGARSLNCSPVHAMAEMSKLHNRLIYLHEDRRRLVKGLKAAKARLENKMMFEDHDGIGQATSRDENGEEILQEFLQRYDHDDEVLPTLDTSLLSPKENYGLNYYSAFSSIPQLTNVALQFFEPYYSPERRSGEEHEMEIASFVAFRALDGFCTPQDIAWALQCTNTIERFNTAYSIMYRHKLSLEKIAEYASQDLRDCGEECTDIF